MGLFGFLKKNKQSEEPPIPENEKQYYRPDSYYTDKAYPGTQFEKAVVRFDERKKTTYPSQNGLYVAEILLLEYCSHGTYPNPKNGYPGLWWFEYGIRNVGAKLRSLESRGFLSMDTEKEKYVLTELGKQELSENEYIPYMHHHRKKTSEDARFGPVFNVWSINSELGQESKRDWRQIVDKKEQELDAFHNQKHSALTREVPPQKTKAHVSASNACLATQDAQLESIKQAEERYKLSGDINALIAFWENIWQNGGLLFNGSHWTFRLPDLYISQKRYDDAIRILRKIKQPQYREKAKGYLEKIESLKKKAK